MRHPSRYTSTSSVPRTSTYTTQILWPGPSARGTSQLRAAVKLAFIWSIDDYLRVDELGGGRGYADLAYIPKPGSKLPPMVVELKWDEPTNAALSQIRKRNYPAALAGLTGPCVLVGVTYRKGTDEHECIIEQIQL